MKQICIFTLALALSVGLVGCVGNQAPSESVKPPESVEPTEINIPEATPSDTLDDEPTELEAEEIAEPQDGGIKLVYGSHGEYGETVTLDGYDYIWFYVPAGSYQITCNTSNCKVYIDKNEIYKDMDGFDATENVQTIDMYYGQTVETTINDGEHIELTIHGGITLIPT